MVLHVLSQIWKFGGIIERDKSDNQLALKNHLKVPKPILDDAAKIFGDIDAYISSVEGMKGADMTLWKMITVFAGWQKNEAISNFLNGDEYALNLFMDYQAKLNGNGWTDIYADWRQFESDESTKMKNEIHQRAVAFMQKGAK